MKEQAEKKQQSEKAAKVRKNDIEMHY